MSKMRFEEFAINCTQKKTPEPSDYSTYIGLEHMDTKDIHIHRWGSDVPIIGEKLVMHKGDILLGKRNAYLRRAAIAPHDGIFSAHGMILRPKTEVVDYDFFALFIASDYFFDEAIRISVGSLSPTINWKDLKGLEFNIPSLEKQKELAEALWSINDTIDSYKDLLRQSDELIKSRFIEMFGEIKESVTVKDCCSIHARIGWQALTKKEHMETGEYMLITGTDFIDGKVNYSTCVYVAKDRYEMDSHIQVRNGDILITKDGTIGKVAVVENLPRPATLNAGVFVLRPDNRFNSEYISYVFKGPLFEEFVEKAKTGSTIKHLNQERLIKFPIPVPTIEQQEEFAALYKQIDKSKLILQDNIAKLEAMYKKIMSKYLRKED